MGKASISIAVSGSYNGSAIERAEKSLERLNVRAAAASDGMAKSWAESGSKIAEAGGSIYNTGERVAAVGDKLTLGITTPLAAAGTAATKSAVDFESSMSRVAGALDDPQANMDELRQLALDMGAATVFGASDAGAAMEELAKGGLTAADIKGGSLATTMDLAAAGSMNLADAANTVVQAMGAFGLTAEDTGRAANALAGGAAASSADVSDLTQGLSQCAAQSNAAGWSIEDTTAVLSAFADAGITGSDAGTSLKTMLQRLAAPTDAAATMIEQLGIETRDSQGHMKDAAGIAEELSTKLGNLDDATRDAALQTIFGSDASRAALNMMNQGRDGIERYTAATHDQTAAQRLADSQMGDTERTIENMNGAIETASISVGSALAPAVTDAANAVGDAADKFNSLDEGTQSAIVGFAGVAAAAGPVLSVSGRIVQGAGSVVTWLGKQKQAASVYADAMTTTDTASLKLYASQDKLNGALSKNKAVEAAGGVKNYLEAVKQANISTGQYSSAVRKLEAEQKKGSKANLELVDNLKAEVAQKKATMEANQGVVTGYQQAATAANASSVAIKASSVGMQAFAVATNVAKAALATFAPMAIIAGITMIADALAKAKEHSDNYKSATEGLTTATEKGATASKAGSSALSAYGESAATSKVDIDGLLESQAQLAHTISDTNTSAGAQMAQLQSAYSAIQQYANQSDLTTEAQGKLRSAVETVNSMCGTQISVTDAANGKLADENGAIRDVTGSLEGYVQKKLEQIKVDAQQQNLTALYQQQAEDITALAQAQKAYNDKQAERDQHIQDYIDKYGPYVQNAQAMAEAAWEGQLATSAEAKAVKEAQGALDAVNTSIGTVSTSLGASVAVADRASASIQNLAASNSTVSTAMQAVGGDLTQFTTDLSNAGVSVDTFRSLNDTQLTKLVTSWDGTTQSIVDTLSDMGVKMDDQGLNAATALANGMASGSVSVDASTAILKAAASGDWSDVSSKMNEAGISLPKSVADGIYANGYAASSATDSMLSAIALKLTGGDVKAAAALLGHDIDSGLANGIKDGALSEEQAELLGDDVIDKAKSALDSHSPSRKFYQIGSDVDAGLSEGISGNNSGPLGAISSLGQMLVGALSGVPGQLGATGSSSGAALGGGIASASGSVGSSAAQLSSAASSGVSGIPGAMGAAGSQASSMFSSGVASGVGSTRTSASRVAAAADSMRNTGDSHSWGQHLAQNFAAGISSGISWVSRAATSIAQAAKDAIGFSVPKTGPWSGAERGGERSGLHLAQNFAAGLSSGAGEVRAAATALMADASLGGDVAPGGASPGGYQPQESVRLLSELLYEIRAFRAEIGYDIAENAPTFPSEREMRRMVREYAVG